MGDGVLSLASLKAPEADKSEYQFDARLFRRIWRLAKPYYARKGAWLPGLAMLAIFSSLPVAGAVGVHFSFVAKDLTNALIAKQSSAYGLLFWRFALLSAVLALVQVGMGFVEGWLQQNWRRWLTMHLVDQYLAKRTYYDIALLGDLDNPDQRIQGNVSAFITMIVQLPRLFLLNIVWMIGGIYILMSISRAMVPVALGFGIAQAVVTYYTSVPTIRKYFNITLAEADLRYGILHVRDHAEAVAFYSGEAAERVHIAGRLQTLIKRHIHLLYYTAFVITGSSQVMNSLLSIFPYLILVPVYLAGHLSYGSVAQAVMAVTLILNAINQVAAFIPIMAAAAPQAIRLAQIQERFQLMEAGRTGLSYPQLEITRTADCVHMMRVTLETPGGEQTLVRNLSLTLRAGEHLVIAGQTGVGKSSLLRAMGGLWTRGHGVLEMPPATECLFLPQKPYMVLADLRSQLLYPHGDAALDDAKLQAILEAVSLPDLAEKYGGLDAVRDWSKVLSLGEQQRIGFARILISRPRYVFVDEATSAVDLATEARLYQVLSDAGATFVSVGHRQSILDYHAHMLTLFPGGTWTLGPVTDTSGEDSRRLLA